MSIRMEMYGYTWPVQEGVIPALTAAYQYYSPSMAVNRRCQQSVWVLDYVISGISDYRMSPTSPWRPRLPDTAHLYPPHTSYWEHLTREEAGNMSSAYILFTGGNAAGLEALLHSTERFAEFHDTMQLLRPLLGEMAKTGQTQSTDGFWTAQAHLCTVLHYLQHSVPRAPGMYDVVAIGQHSGASNFVHTVNAYLQAHLAERITLEEIAVQLHISVSTLSHRYRRETGVSPMHYVQTLRVAAAKVLLVHGFPLKNIAVMTGFYDAFHLSKSFKQTTGCSPREYLARESGGNHLSS